MAASPQDRFARLSTLFHAAVELPAGAGRDAWMDAHCGGDAGLREELNGLLASDRAASSPDAPAAARLPRFGIYQARERIGMGGMGAVYRATREDGEVRQQVAIKAVASTFPSPLSRNGYGANGRSWRSCSIPISRRSWAAASPATASPTW